MSFIIDSWLSAHTTRRPMNTLRLSYQTLEFEKIDIHLCTLRDKQEFYDPEGAAEHLGICSASWPMFGVIWPSSLVLAHYMLDYNTGSKRILEVGCGTAVSSLLLNKKNADITATDHHPEAGIFLERNTQLNENKSIDFIRTSWAERDNTLGKFDLIIGSDLLYEEQHIELLSIFINDHAKPTCEIIIVDPGRGRQKKLCKQMQVLGYTTSQFKPIHTNYLDEAFKGHILKFERSI